MKLGYTSGRRAIASDVKLGRDVKIYDFVNLYGCEIGDQTKIGTFVEIQKGAKIGRRVKISSHTFICEGVTIEDDAFIGHGVTFTNDLYPRATTSSGRPQTDADWTVIPTMVRRGTHLLYSVTSGESNSDSAANSTSHPGYFSVTQVGW